MSKIAVLITIGLLVSSFAFTSYASYNGAGLAASGSANNSRAVWFPIFVGGGPGSGK